MKNEQPAQMIEIVDKGFEESERNFRNCDYTIVFNYKLVSELDNCYHYRGDDGKMARFINDWEIDIMAYPMFNEDECEVEPVLAGKAKVQQVLMNRMFFGGVTEPMILIVDAHSKELFDTMEQLFDFDEEDFYDERNQLGSSDVVVIEAIVLKSEYQRAGIGTALMQEINEKFQDCATIAGRAIPCMLDKNDEIVSLYHVSGGHVGFNKFQKDLQDWCTSMGMVKTSRDLYYLPMATTLKNPVETRMEYLQKEVDNAKRYAENARNEQERKEKEAKKAAKKKKVGEKVKTA